MAENHEVQLGSVKLCVNILTQNRPYLAKVAGFEHEDVLPWAKLLLVHRLEGRLDEWIVGRCIVGT